jgi:hypothetical protein
MLRNILRVAIATGLLALGPALAQSRAPIPWTNSPIPPDAKIVYQWDYICQTSDHRHCSVSVMGDTLGPNGPSNPPSNLDSFSLVLAVENVAGGQVAVYYYRATFANSAGSKFIASGFTHNIDEFRLHVSNLIVQALGAPTAAAPAAK